MAGPLARALLLSCLGTLAAWPMAAAQHAPVSLRIQPRIGDTLYSALDQHVEVTSPGRAGGADTTMLTTSMVVFSHALVRRADANGAVILTTTDSVRIATDSYTPEWVERARRELMGKQVRMRVTPEGATELLDHDEESLSDAARQLFSEMPATLPPRPVAVGESWTRRMGAPFDASDGKSAGSLKATFRLDSLSADDKLAYISMKAVISRGTVAVPAKGMSQQMTGTVTGTMVIDRGRGWMTDSRTTMTVRTVITPPEGVRAPPMQVRLKVTQWLRTVER